MIKEITDQMRKDAEARLANKTGNDAEDKRDVAAPKERRKDKPKTKAEIEAYRQKMIEKEEAMYLRKRDSPKKPEAQDRPKVRRKKRNDDGKAQDRVRVPKTPKMLEPLQILYLLKIPGMPKGDCIAICLAHGAES